MSLFIKQEGETLRSYMAHFNAATLEVKDFNKSVTISALKWGLRSDRLNFLDKNFSRNYADLVVRTTKCAHVEEVYFICREEGKRQNGKKRAHEKKFTFIRKLPNPRRLQNQTIMLGNSPTILPRPSLDLRSWWRSKIKAIYTDHYPWKVCQKRGTRTNIVAFTEIMEFR